MTAPANTAERSYAELVLHVLAHVPLPEPGSLYEPSYVDWCAARLTRSDRRELGQDADVLSQLLAPLDVRLRAQLLPRLFVADADAARAGLLDLTDFPDQGVRSYDEDVWRHLVLSRTEVEVLRVVCEVERLHLVEISPPNPDPTLQKYLVEMTDVAPGLAALRVSEYRPLWTRGRLMPGAIWVGSATPGEGPGLEHVAWQAAHEATLSELSNRWRATAGYDFGLECGALALLWERARRHGRAADHERWFRTLGGELPRGVDELQGRAPPELERLVRSLCDG